MNSPSLNTADGSRHTPTSARPYRSKRQPPCDQCRRKKLRCQGNGREICSRCQTSGSVCSFSAFLRDQFNREARILTAQAEEGVASVGVSQEAHSPANSEPSHRCHSGPVLHTDPLRESYPGSHTSRLLSQTPTPKSIQTIQTLDQLEGLSYQVIGTSGESDPWLLRHCRFDERGFLPFHHVHLRNAGGVPLDEKIPVHFLVSADHLYSSDKERTSFLRQGCTRERLNNLVPLTCGQRLVALFIQFIFPNLPIVSRSQLGLSRVNMVPEQAVLQSIPVHLLAAIYASAQPFAKYDGHLSVLNAYSTPPTEELWRLVLELLLREIHTPHLSTLQAGLLYLQKSTDEKQSVIADTPFVWSLVGMLVGLATSLGLQLECRPMGLPTWEKRLRRRLWWAIYAEDKWRSLLMGRPPYIRNEEWDVTDLDDVDFRIDDLLEGLLPLPNGHSQPELLHAQPFQHLVRLSRLAEEVQHDLYSLRAAQRLSPDFNRTVQVARPLFERLKNWYSLLPASLQQQSRPTTSIDRATPQSSCLRFSYILLEIFIFRALLRPMVLSAAPPPLFEEFEDLASFMNQVDVMNETIDGTFQTAEMDEIEPVLAIDISDQNSAGSAALRAADNCAMKILRFVTQMTNRDLSEFWFSWSSIGFAAISNYMMLLLVQSPTKDHADRANRLLCLWRQSLRSQSQGCRLMNLALVRLGEMYSADLSRNFYLSKHVKEAFDHSHRGGSIV